MQRFDGRQNSASASVPASPYGARNCGTARCEPHRRRVGASLCPTSVKRNNARSPRALDRTFTTCRGLRRAERSCPRCDRRQLAPRPGTAQPPLPRYPPTAPTDQPRSARRRRRSAQEPYTPSRIAAELTHILHQRGPSNRVVPANPAPLHSRPDQLTARGHRPTVDRPADSHVPVTHKRIQVHPAMITHTLGPVIPLTRRPPAPISPSPLAGATAKRPCMGSARTNRTNRVSYSSVRLQGQQE